MDANRSLALCYPPFATLLDPPERDSQPENRPRGLNPHRWPRFTDLSRHQDRHNPPIPAAYYEQFTWDDPDFPLLKWQDPHWSTAKAAAMEAGDPDVLSVNFRHSGWLHNRGLVAASICRTGQSFSRRRNFANCGSDAYVLRSLEQPDVYRLAGSACHDRFCLPCALERSRAISLNVLELTEGRQTRFLTLTLKASNEPLTVQLDKLYNSFQALRRRKFWKDRVYGGIAFLEITWSHQHQTWHPHFHLLIEGHYLAQQKLKTLWYNITGDSFVVDIRFVRDLRTAARYVTKYASKPFNNTFLNRPAQLDEALLAFKGRKLLLTFGTWRGVTLIKTPSEGSWEHVAPLNNVITDAAHGDPEARAILKALTDTDLQPLFDRVPPGTPPARPPPMPLDQLTFFDAWQQDGTYIWTGKNELNPRCPTPL